MMSDDESITPNSEEMGLTQKDLEVKGQKQFLPQKYQELPGSKEVEKAVQQKIHRGEKGDTTKEDRVETYLERVDRILSSGTSVNDERGWELLRDKLIKEYTINTDDTDTLARIAHGLYESEKKLAIEQGRGADVANLEGQTDANIIERYTDLVKEKRDIQESSLTKWLSYLKQNDAQYPGWFRYYVVRELRKMGTLDKEKGEYSKRSPHTVASFPELNSEALGYVYRMLTEGPAKGEYEEGSDKADTLTNLIGKKDFARLYAFSQLETVGKLNRESLIGQWKKYDQDSRHQILEEALRGKGTGWCTAEGSAYAHLQGGDFYVYFTKGEDSTFDQPRIAIRIEGDSVAEVRGVNPRQELEPVLLDTAQSKYHSLPGGEKFDKKTADMKKVTSLVQKQEKGEAFTREDLRFLYEFDAFIEGFGYEKDPRIADLIRSRDAHSDVSSIIGIPKEKISLTREEALEEGIIYHYGNLDLPRYSSGEGITLPERVSGYVDLGRLTNAEGITLPKEIGGSLGLGKLTRAEGLVLPKKIGGSLYLGNLTSAEGITMPDRVGGLLDLESLTSAKGLLLPKEIDGGLKLDSLTSAEGITMPDRVGSLSLLNLTSVAGLTLPKEIGSSLIITGLTSVAGLTFPKEIGRYLDLRSLTSTEGLTLPEKIGAHLDLRSLFSAEGLTLPREVGESIVLTSLSSAERDKLKALHPQLKIIQ